MKKENLKVEATLDNFDKVRNFFIEFLEDNKIPLSMIMKFEIVLEELFVNVCHYAYEDTGDIECICEIDDNNIYLTLIDKGRPYNPFAREDPDINAPIEERPIGGLGIFLVKKNTDTHNYSFEDDKNIVKLSFKK